MCFSILLLISLPDQAVELEVVVAFLRSPENAFLRGQTWTRVDLGRDIFFVLHFLSPVFCHIWECTGCSRASCCSDPRSERPRKNLPGFVPAFSSHINICFVRTLKKNWPGVFQLFNCPEQLNRWPCHCTDWGVPSQTKSVVFLNIVQKAVDPPVCGNYDKFNLKFRHFTPNLRHFYP